MCNVEVIRSCRPQIGIKTRPKTNGPELEFVESFIEQQECRLNASDRKSDALILVEPRIDSGYPDMILMFYTDHFMANWQPERKKLSDVDLKILSYINTVNATKLTDVGLALGFDANQVNKSLGILQECRMIAIKGEMVSGAKRTNYLGLKRVVAFEAKQSDVRGAVDQAAKNTRFANESYVLLSSNRPSNATIDQCRKANVGLVSGERFSVTLRPRRRPLPNNYVTLKLNEWLGMRLAQRMA